MCTIKFPGLPRFRGAFTLRLAPGVWGCAPVRCKAALARRVLRTKQPSRSWRRAPIFASARRGAPQKSAKRKRIQWVPSSFRISQGSAGPLRSGSLSAFGAAPRYDANSGMALLLFIHRRNSSNHRGRTGEDFLPPLPPKTACIQDGPFQTIQNKAKMENLEIGS